MLVIMLSEKLLILSQKQAVMACLVYADLSQTTCVLFSQDGRHSMPGPVSGDVLETVGIPLPALSGKPARYP